MAKIVFLKPRKRVAGAAERANPACAEIIFFPGVRYEPLVDGLPCARGIGRRWTLLPIGSAHASV